MNQYVLTLVTAFCLLNACVCDVFEEPICSKFHFEEKVLEKLVKLEVRIDGELKQMNDKTDKLVTRVTELSESVIDLKKTVQENSYIEDKISGLKTPIKDVIEVLQRNISEYQVIAEKELTFNNKGIHFVAHTPSSTRLDHNKPVIYKTTTANHGDGYDTNTGIFTAPVAGVYVFSTQLCLQKSVHSHYQIVINGTPYSSSRHYGSFKGLCSSVSTTSSLSKGDRVWVKILTYGVEVTNSVISVPTWNMFCGALVN